MIDYLKRYKQIIKFLIAGGLVNLLGIFLLYVFTNVLGIWYLISSSLAITISFSVSFILQKFWTFEDKTRQFNLLARQLFLYGLVFVVDFIVNALLMYGLVGRLGLWYLLAQLITSGLIAIANFVIYKFFIFNRPQLINDK